jgi:hypothetical protein
MQRIARLAASLGVAAVLGLLVPVVASAHEGREVANGQYEVVIGFLDEPAFVGEKNAMIVEVVRTTTGAAATPTTDEEGGAPVEGLNDTLKAEVIFGDQKMELEVRPLFGQPGSYVGYFFPMAEGDYSFRIFGDIEGNPIDETFTSGPETFASVQPREPLEFPKQSASASTVLGFPAAIGVAGLIVGGAVVGRKRLRRT